MRSMNREEQQEADRARQQEVNDARHAREAAARPSLLHRAIVFLLQETVNNNRDTTEEAGYYLRELDRALASGEDLEALVQVTAAAPPAITPTAEGGNQSEQFDTAAALRQSSRYGSRTGIHPATADPKPPAARRAPRKAAEVPEPEPVKQSSRFRRR